MPLKSRVGISALAGKPDLSGFAAHLAEIEALGVDTIELPTFDQDLVVGGRIRRDQLAALKRACAGRKVGYTVHGPLAINFMDDPFRLPRHFEVLEASLEVAAELGASNYVLHTGFRPMGLSQGIEDAYRRQREWLSAAGEVAKSRKLMICVENLFDETWGKVHTGSASRLAAEIAAVNHPNVGATVDFSHAYLETGFRGGNLVEEVAKLAPLAPHLHIHDSFGRPDDIYMYTTGERLAYGHGDLHLPVGWGDLPWDEIMAKCRFKDGVVFNIELDARYWHLAKEVVDVTRAMAERAVKLGSDPLGSDPS